MYILIVDDNKELQFSLKNILKEAGYKIEQSLTIKDAKEKLQEKVYDLILLDWILPDGSGVELLEDIRKDEIKTPVLFFSSKNEVVDKVKALDSGADDYLEKPFSNIELLARIRALLRREVSQKQSVIKIGALQIDTKKRVVKVDEKVVNLSSKEFELLEFLAMNSGVVLTKYQLLEHINRDFESFTSSNIVEAHIKNLRKKLGKPEIIKTIRGVGYVIKKS